MDKKRDIKREIREHPERFDYADIPATTKLTPMQQKQADEGRPEWLKKRLERIARTGG